jgi:catechol 2,3-dioxygenase-like lactoylglutathione lyase family enzyme
VTPVAGDLVLARGLVDVGLMTNQTHEMLRFWCDEVGLAVERTLQPVPGVTQHKLTMHGAVLKLNCLDAPLPTRARLGGLRMLILAAADVDGPTHLRDPDGNQLCLVPPGFGHVTTLGVHFAVSDEPAFHDFFARTLGLPRLGERTYDFAGAALSFAWSPDVVPAGPATSAGFGYLTFQVMDVAAAHAQVCGRGAVEERPPSDAHTSSDASISFIHDPDGNRIELSQRPDLVAAANR